ncbi:hypothetical protein [Metabacillus niabensis]|uniref:hypothetical protein n=1 Tax=Metabacillus niabensis TaxID=324854 RepID=UPI0011AA17B2
MEYSNVYSGELITKSLKDTIVTFDILLSTEEDPKLYEQYEEIQTNLEEKLVEICRLHNNNFIMEWVLRRWGR